MEKLPTLNWSGPVLHTLTLSFHYSHTLTPSLLTFTPPPQHTNRSPRFVLAYIHTITLPPPLHTHRVDGRVWVDLESVHIVPRVLEETVRWIQHLMAEKVHPFSCDPPIVQPILSSKLDEQFLFKVTHTHLHNLPVRLLKDIFPGCLHPTMASLRLHCIEL